MRCDNYVNVDVLGVDGLRHIVAALEAHGGASSAPVTLTSDGVDELAQMIADGRHPTIGWWRRHGQRIQRAEIPPGRRRPPDTLAVTRWAAEMVQSGWPEPRVAEAVVSVAVEAGLRQGIAERACARGIALGRRRRRGRYGR